MCRVKAQGWEAGIHKDKVVAELGHPPHLGNWGMSVRSPMNLTWNIKKHETKGYQEL